jgi:hypothetical protein
MSQNFLISTASMEDPSCSIEERGGAEEEEGRRRRVFNQRSGEVERGG